MSQQSVSKINNIDRPVDDLVEAVKEVIRNEGKRDEKLMQICLLLHENVDKYDWVGFYLADPNADRELILGPYVGAETNHTDIPFGTGICGQAAETLETFVVDDVQAESNYLSCGAAVKSEIVIPILKDGKFVAELDIDSHTRAAITPKDQEMLEAIANLTASVF